MASTVPLQGLSGRSHERSVRAHAEVGEGRAMTGSGKVVVIALWAVILGEAVAIAAWYGAIPGFEDRLAQAALDAGGVVLLIGAVSVGIERAIEYLWTIT